jgi:ABC-type glutathione transport system ATPase component
MNHANAASSELMSVRGLCKRYVQQRPFRREHFTVSAFEEVSLSIYRGRTLAIVGESGAGKSTLARCLALIERPTQGEIFIEGKPLLGLGREELFPLRRRVQIVFQDPTASLNPRMRATEIVSEPLVIHRIGTKAETRECARRLMKQVGLPAGCEDRRPFELSGGQRQRLAIARALALKPQLLILDEALASLDLLNRELIIRLLADLQDAFSLAYVHVSHDLRLVSRFADEVVVMRDGRIVEQQPASRLFAHPECSYTRELLAAMPSLPSIYASRFGRECP